MGQGGAGARTGEAPLRAAAAAITIAGVAGVSVAQLAAACFAGDAAAAAAAAECLSGAGCASTIALPGASADGACLVAAASAAPYRLAAPGIAGGRVAPWDALAHALQPVSETRAIALALRHPGAPEDALAAAMSALPPGVAAALLQRLAAEGKLSVRTVAPAAPQWQPPVKRRQGLPPAQQPQPQRHYFAGPLAVQFLS